MPVARDQNQDPLVNHPKYEKVSDSPHSHEVHHADVLSHTTLVLYQITLLVFMYMQVRDINAGAFGFVQLARNKFTGQQVAIKFLPRGSAINKHVGRPANFMQEPMCLLCSPHRAQ